VKLSDFVRELPLRRARSLPFTVSAVRTFFRLGAFLSIHWLSPSFFSFQNVKMLKMLNITKYIEQYMEFADFFGLIPFNLVKNCFLKTQ
jgi:hypothetical protein